MGLTFRLVTGDGREEETGVLFSLPLDTRAMCA